MATLLEDIRSQADWIVKAFKTDKLKLDYSLESLKMVDHFFDLHVKDGKPKAGGRLSQNLGPILFSIGAYVGETILRQVPGAVWVTDDKDPEGEVNIQIRLPDGTILWPAQRVIKRFQNGAEDAIYPYGAVVIGEIAKGDYWDKAAQAAGRIDGDAAVKKPWWKFW